MVTTPLACSMPGGGGGLHEGGVSDDGRNVHQGGRSEGHLDGIVLRGQIFLGLLDLRRLRRKDWHFDLDGIINLSGAMFHLLRASVETQEEAGDQRSRDHDADDEILTHE
jgi:hypothetical protein